ncbi:MAG: VWA domain-containing protein [Planctomycetaceae bacterium]|nr:VWA domain-containing protein [Planctomycetaceae bacterium]
MPLPALWSFASPWLLLWGAAAALPVLIHLWSRRRYFETPWAATQFLLAAIRRHQRRIQIEHWLLLAIRVLILLLLAFALAEPVVSGLAGAGDPTLQPPTHTVLVIDTSYSMAYESGGTSRFSNARIQAARLVEDAAPGDAFSLVTLADPPEVIVGEASTSHAAILDEINQLEISNQGADLTATLEQVESLVNSGRDEFEHQRVHIFSDLGKTTWAETTSSSWRSRLTALSKHAACRLSAIGTEATPENAAITRLAVPSGRVHVGVPISVEVEVENFGSHSLNHKRIELVVDGQSVGEQTVDLEAGGQATAFFSVTLNVAGDHLLVATIGDDGLKLDNKRWLSVPVRDATRILCVQGRPHAAEYIALALQPEAGQGGLISEVASEHAILERTLQAYDCLFLCNVARFTPTEAARLRQYVEQGGGLIFVLGDLVRADLYNEQLGRDSPANVLPAQLNEVVAGGHYSFNPLEYRHAITQPFRSHERAGLLTVPTWRYFRLDQLSDSATVALAFDSGDPAVVDAVVGQGRVLVLATAASPESIDRATDPPTPWTALASWPSFPPLVHELAHIASRDRVAQSNVHVGDPITLQLPPELKESHGTLTVPTGKQHPIRIAGTERFWNYGETNVPGVYSVAFDEESTSPAFFAVNLRTIESNLDRVSRDSLVGLFDEQPRPGTSSSTLVERDAPLFRVALGGLLVLLVVETFLASYFGRATR